MSQQIAEKPTWKETLISWSQPSALSMLFLGFSAGLPLLLIFSTLTFWLKEADVSRSMVTFFSWAGLGYSFKFIWAPLVDLLPLPFLTRVLGRRRSWILVSQLLIIFAICWMGMINPANESGLMFMAFAAVMLGFSSATQDIVVDAYRIERDEESMQALLASMYFTGYRIAMLVSGAGSLYLASWLGTRAEAYYYPAWRMTYLIMAAVMLIGVVTTLVIKEPCVRSESIQHDYGAKEYTQVLGLFALVASAFALTFFYSGSVFTEIKTQLNGIRSSSGTAFGFTLECIRFAVAVCSAGLVARLLIALDVVDRQMVRETYVLPVLDFFNRYKLRMAILLLLLVGFYRISDIVLGVISNLFYYDIGFSKNEVATISKFYGLIMTLVGGLLGGVLTVRYGVNRILFVGALLSAATNLLFMVLAKTGTDMTMLTLVIAADNLSGGIAVTAFIAFLSSLTSVSFTAVQYSIFSSTMTLFPKLIGGYSGMIVNAVGYESFFLLTACMGIPVLFLVWFVRGETS